jgi:ATP/maltotriose-dependent transcriptional regulator MalT
MFLETIREFALEQLAASGDADTVRERHAAWFLRLAEEGGLAIWIAGPSQMVWLSRLEDEHDNLRAAAQWFVETGAAELELRLSAALASFWMVRGHVHEGRARLDAGLARGQAVAPLVRANALLVTGYMAALQGEHLNAQRLLDEAQPLLEDCTDLQLRALWLVTRGFVARTTGQLASAVELFAESLSLVRAGGMTPPGILRWQHATTLLWSGDLASAYQLHGETLADALAGGDRFTAAAVLCDLGIIAFLRGDLDRAAHQLREAAMLARQLGDVLVTAMCLDALAVTAGAQERPAAAAMLLSAAERLFARSGVAPDGTERTGRPLPTGLTVAQFIDATRTALGEPAFDTARKAGHRLTVEEVLAAAVVERPPRPRINPVDDCAS